MPLAVQATGITRFLQRARQGGDMRRADIAIAITTQCPSALIVSHNKTMLAGSERGMIKSLLPICGRSLKRWGVHIKMDETRR